LQEIFDFVSAEVVNQGVPVLVVAFARVSVFVQRGTVKLGKPVVVGREVSDYPVKNDADACIVCGFNQGAQFVGRTETAGRRIQSGRLIAPRAVKRVFGHGQEFDMGEAHVFDVCDQFFGELFVSQPEVVFGIAFPRTQMHFINADGRVNGVGAGTEVGCVHFFRQTAHDRCGIRTQLCAKGIRVGFLPHIAVGIADFKFVEGVEFDGGNEDVPNAVVAVETHDVAAAVPVVEFADDGHALRVRRPYGKAHAFHAVHFGKMRA